MKRSIKNEDQDGLMFMTVTWYTDDAIVHREIFSSSTKPSAIATVMYEMIDPYTIALQDGVEPEHLHLYRRTQPPVQPPIDVQKTAQAFVDHWRDMLLELALMKDLKNEEEIIAGRNQILQLSDQGLPADQAIAHILEADGKLWARYKTTITKLYKNRFSPFFPETQNPKQGA